MRIFVSYASNDREKVTRLVRALQVEKLEIWFDDDQVLPGDDILEKIRDGIRGCRHYLLCLSPSFELRPPQSWAKNEFRMAMLKEHRESANCIVPVRIKAGGGIPDEIGGRAYADMTTPKRWAKNFHKLITALKR